ncbi:multicopper oxidase domain-containing protein [uncultured Clostridium sp.]|uniref:multicopper oxidase domain-containing protein n=1 Tax=uncultured Clostridium sp. TaxID=59620 RepID=UPI002671915A|nr:multicopper oxidase domain-containing protein [uncultured Clostridium sp.]
MVNEGDNVCVRVINKLPERTSVHFHGLEIANDMDGVQPVEPSPYIEPNEYFDYKFKIKNPPGTYMYHSHVNVMVQDNAGLLGGFIVNDSKDDKRKNYKDYLILLQ